MKWMLIRCGKKAKFLLKMFNILQHISAKYVSFMILKAGATLYKLHNNYESNSKQSNS